MDHNERLGNHHRQLNKRELSIVFKALMSPGKSDKRLAILSRKYNWKKENISTFDDLNIVLSRQPLLKANLVHISKKLRLSNQQAAMITGISARTYQRWKLGHKLNARDSGHLLKIVELYSSGMYVFN